MTIDYSHKRVVVTGSAGFIGSHLVDALISVGADVVGVDNLQSGVLDNLRQSIDKMGFFQADVRDRESLRKIIEGSDIVFHLAGNALVPYSVENPLYDFESNVIGTYHILQLLREHRIGRVVFSSSAAVYGIPRYTPEDENHPLEPVSPYGASKLAAERLGAGWARTYNIEFVIARIYNTYGPRQRKYVMYDLLNKLHNNSHKIEVLGDGSQTRDYSFVSDTVRALLLIGKEGQSGEAYNIAGDHPVRISKLLSLLIQLMNIENIEVVYTGKSWVGDVPTMIANIEKLKSLGFTPKVNLEEGLITLRNWVAQEIWRG
jgi:UDP-glucose 4-epimerase